MNGQRNGTGPEHDDLDRDLQRAADQATATWKEREQALRERWEQQQETSRSSAAEAADAAVEDWDRQTRERVDRIQGSSAERAHDIQARLDQLRGMADDLEAARRAYQEQSFFGRFKRWWNGLGKRSSR